jgi:predicted RNase H-like nuclease (RuvC/YqgF family)
MKLTREQIGSRKRQAVRFLRDVAGDSERAAEIEQESLDDYARRRKIEILNPNRRAIMPRKTIDDYRSEVADLKDELAELEVENESLQSQLDEIAEIVSPEEEEEEDEDEATGE